ncbi:glycoside hydrolase family 76 protein, partial [Moniliophthora roreri]
SPITQLEEEKYKPILRPDKAPILSARQASDIAATDPSHSSLPGATSDVKSPLNPSYPYPLLRRAPLELLHPLAKNLSYKTGALF